MTDLFSIFEDTLLQGVEDILTEIGYTDPQVIFSHQTGLEPSNTYCIINVLGIDQTGQRNEASYADTETNTLESLTHYIGRIQFTFLGKKANDMSFSFRHHLVNNRVCFEILQKYGFGILFRGDIRRIPQKRETQFVECCNFDMNFSFAVNTVQEVDWIEYVTVNGDTFRVRNVE